MSRQEHKAQGDPCSICLEPADRHRNRVRPEHKSAGDPCAICGLAAYYHRAPRGPRFYPPKKDPRTNSDRVTYLGIDGEGQSAPNGTDHHYVLLACSDEVGSQEYVLRPHPSRDRLTTIQCLDFLMQLPTYRTKIFSYSFNYDLTMILRDVDNSTLYHLFRPELRARLKNPEKGPWPVRWNEWFLNLQGTKFTLHAGKDSKRIIVWDLFRFYQSKFVSALKEWKVGDESMRARMTVMKDKRSEFDKVDKNEVERYCLSECRAMAELGRKLVDAHTEAGLTLKSYYGAGSSGAAMLDVMGIRGKIAKPMPEMREAVACSFFGGRFENSVIGTIEEQVWGYDISSAYPYQTFMLPCLEHGRWIHTTKRKDLDGKRASLVHYGLSNQDRIVHWGPFPFRDPNGTISYPSESGGGWVWSKEYLAGERLFPKSVQFREAWVYETDCICRPFERIPEFYVLRLQIGKDGPGIVIKLAVNSVYGKLAQSLGNAPFNCWIWASMITSGCRAQMLEMLALHKHLGNALMIATDGLYTRERIVCPKPIETGTGELIHGKSKPLGGWEEKLMSKGVFCARPGIYFPLHPTEEELKEVRARGIGKGVVFAHWDTIQQAWEKYGVTRNVIIAGYKPTPEHPKGETLMRFCGAKTSISKERTLLNWEEMAKQAEEKGEAIPPEWTYNRATGKDNGPAYGQWVPRPVEMSFNPKPKRDGIAPDGKTLIMRRYPAFLSSKPYRKALIEGKELLELLMTKLQQDEQPDKDLVVM